MALAVHPARDDRGGRGVAHGDVLARRAVAEAEGAEHPEGRAVGRAVVREVTVIMHILRLVARDAGKLPVLRQRGKAVLRALGVHKADDLLLAGADGGIRLGDGQHVAGVDEIRICDLRIRVDDLARADLILHGELPHRVAALHGVGRGKCRDGHGRGCQQRQRQGKQFFHGTFSFSCFLRDLLPPSSNGYIL